MALRITQLMFVSCCMVMGYIWADHVLRIIAEGSAEPMMQSSLILWRSIGTGLGAIVSLTVLFLVTFITQEIFERLFPVVIAISFSMIIGWFAAHYILENLSIDDPSMRVFLSSTLVLVFGYVGISLGLTRASNWESLVTAVKRRHIEYGSPKLVDTSVLIDGRIADIVNARFIEGTLIIPRFVLRELQNIADSEDLLRRTKGRRGLDILKAMQDDAKGVDVEIIEDDPEHIREVDAKLVYIAKEFSAKIITNDFNLNKVAQIEGIDVLNINDLANALKPAALPEENLNVKIVKEGKEAYQGVGYLEDGTMIVVDGGRDFIGKQVDVIVTSVLQTTAGRMIFTKMPESKPEPASTLKESSHAQ